MWVLCGCASTASMSWTSAGTITHVTVRSALGDPHRPVDQVADARGLVGLLAERRCDVAVELQQLHLLLEVAADRADERLSDDRDDRLVVELGVVEPVEQVDRARAGGGHADPDLAGELGVRRRP